MPLFSLLGRDQYASRRGAGKMRCGDCSTLGSKIALDARMDDESDWDCGRTGRLPGARILIISDGKAGHEAQSKGVAQALGGDISWHRVEPSGLNKMLAPWMPADARSKPAPPWPDIAIATGRLAMPALRSLKSLVGIGTYRVALQDPRTSSSVADLIWCPEHDKRRGANVITTLTSPHPFSADVLEELRARPLASIAELPTPRIGVIVGGPNKVFSYTSDDITRLAEGVEAVARSGAGLMITPSRRTPPELMAAIDKASKDGARIVWRGEGDNPYPQFLANADAFIVTADSVSMTGEAVATGQPVHIFTPSGGSAKFAKFHDALAELGATRPLTFEGGALASWHYSPLHAAETIADEIARRYRARKSMLPGLMRG